MGKLRGRIGAALTVAMIVANAAQAQDACWTKNEVAAARVRDLQTRLMVGALKCQTNSFRVADRYNQFIEHSRSALNDYNDVLKVRFIRVHGVRDGQRFYDEFTTRLANAHSMDAGELNFCGTVDQLAGLAGVAPAADLTLLAAQLAERPVGVGEDCQVGIPTSPVQALAPTPAVVESAASAPRAIVSTGAAPHAVSGPAPTAPTALPLPAVAAAAAAGPAVSEGVAPARAPTTDSAVAATEPAVSASVQSLQAAVAALQAATLALQAVVQVPATTPVASAPPANPGATMIEPAPIVPPGEPTIGS